MESWKHTTMDTIFVVSIGMDILGISEPHWKGSGHINLEGYRIMYYGNKIVA